MQKCSRNVRSFLFRCRQRFVQVPSQYCCVHFMRTEFFVLALSALLVGFIHNATLCRERSPRTGVVPSYAPVPILARIDPCFCLFTTRLRSVTRWRRVGHVDEGENDRRLRKAMKARSEPTGEVGLGCRLSVAHRGGGGTWTCQTRRRPPARYWHTSGAEPCFGEYATARRTAYYQLRSAIPI